MEEVKSALVCLFCEQTYYSREDYTLQMKCHDVLKSYFAWNATRNTHVRVHCKA